MKIEVPISIGELFDKFSILEIKKDKIQDEKKLELINEEISLLSKSIIDVIKNNKEYESSITSLMKQLKKINEELWDIENAKRECEKKQSFDSNFIKLARLVYLKNDERAELKKQINMKCGSKIVEVKSYNKY